MTAAKLELLSRRAAGHSDAGHWAAARADWLLALDIVPDSADVMLEISYVESLAGHYRDARDWSLRAARATPRSVDGLSSLVSRLRTFNEGAALHALAARLLDDPRSQHRVLVECAMQLSNLNDFGLALQCSEVAMARAPDDLPARIVRGQLLVHHGRTEEAADDFDWALERNPRIGTVWWMLSRLRKQTADSNHVGRLRALLRTPGLRTGDVAAGLRALHKELDDLGDYEGAWQALRQLCATMRPTVNYQPRETRALFDALIALPAVGQPGPLPQAPGRTPVFIVGMHRSGTTLVEQMLDASPQVRGLGELYDFTSGMRYATDHYCSFPIDATIVDRAGVVDLAGVGRRYLDGLDWRLAGPESHFTDKQPANFVNLGFICRALPQARILHMVRDPMETCFSNLRELFTGINGYSWDQLELADYFRQYRRLMAHWHAQFPGRILDVDYTRLTADPEPVMREVAGFCGIEYSDGMRSTGSSKRAVGTASAVQVREAVVARSTPKWQPYARHLQPMREALGPDPRPSLAGAAQRSSAR